MQGTGCAADSTFAFFGHAGHDHRLTLYFMGGGACWNSRDCDVHGSPTFDFRVDSTDDPSRGSGILDLSNAQNPVRGHTVVVVPYCTGDVFLGTRTVEYAIPDSAGAPERTFRIRHQGAANARSVLDWVFAHIAEPDLIFVTGSSGGAIATSLFASRLAGHYPRARIVQLGDAAGGYRAPAIPGLLAHWGAINELRRDAAYRSIDSAKMTFEAFYIVVAATTPRVTFSQYNSAADAAQLRFLRMVGVRRVPLQQLLSSNLAEIRNANPRFRAYTGPGQEHAILVRPAFYSLAVDGITFRDWVAGLLTGAEIQDVGQSLLAPNAP